MGNGLTRRWVATGIVNVWLLGILCLFGGVRVEAHPGDGLDVDSRGNIYFTDVNTRTLWKLDSQGRLSAALADRWAHGLCVDDQDRVWLEVEVDNTRYAIVRLELDGTETRVIEARERGLDIYGVNLLVDREESIYFPHSDPPRFSSAGIRKRKVDGSVDLVAGGSALLRLDGQGAGARFAGIRSMRFGPKNRIYVVDADAIRRVSMTEEVETLFTDLTLEDPPNQPFGNGNPSVSNRLYGLDIAPDESVYVAYHGDRCVLKLNDEGERHVVYRSEKPWSPVGVRLIDGELLIKETGLEPGSASPGPRIRRLKADGSVETIVVVGE